MADDNSGGKRAIPYVSFSTLETLVKDLQEHGVPSRIDRSVMKRFSGGIASQLLTSLRALEMIDGDGAPTVRLRAFARAYGTDDWREQVGLMVRDIFAPLIALDLSVATPSQFNECLRQSYVGGDDNQRKASAFFFNAARIAEISIGSRLLTNKRASPVKRRAPRKNGKGAEASTVENAALPAPPPAVSMTMPLSHILIDMLDTTEMSHDEMQAVWTLVQYQKRLEAAATVSPAKA